MLNSDIKKFGLSEEQMRRNYFSKVQLFWEGHKNLELSSTWFDTYNSFMGSFLEFIFSNSPIYFSKFCLFCFLLGFFEVRSKESIDGAGDWFDISPYFWSSKKK